MCIRDRVYIITAEDEAGNISTLEVTMKPIDTLFEPVKDVDKETVEKGDKDDLEDVKKQLEDLPDTATEEEQKKIDDFLDQIEDALDTLDNVDEMEEELQELPDPKDVQPDDEEAEQQIKQAQDDFDNGLTDHEKELVDDELLQKLEDLQKALVDYKIISGDGSVWKRGSGKTQVFIANGQLKKFQTLKLDGKDVSSSDYTLEAGSTVVTFEPAFMQGLKRGSHTIQFIYSDGQTPEGSFEVKQSANYLDLTGNKDFKKHKEIWINGKSYPIEEIGGRYVNLPKSGDLLTVYTYLNGTSEGSYTNYPTSMKVYRINRSEKGTTVKLIPKLNNLLRYSGCSIRVTGKPGIRMITSLTQANKNALTGKGLAGFKLVEYGTVVQWADTLGDQDLTLSTGKHNYAYKKGVADPVYNTTGSLTQYTNVLVGFSKSECKKDIVMRPYIILKDAAGNRYTLYGGCVTRSISYIAWQNRNTYEPGTDAYNYVHKLMGKKKAG